MSLLHWNPRNEVFGLDLLDRFVSPDIFLKPVYAPKEWLPKTDVTEDENGYKITMELSGVDKADIDLKVEDGVLYIKGERKSETDDKSLHYHRTERRFGSFERSFKLPKHTDSNLIIADFKNGLLTITVPKSEAAKPKSIDITVS